MQTQCKNKTDYVIRHGMSGFLYICNEHIKVYEGMGLIMDRPCKGYMPNSNCEMNGYYLINKD